MTVRYCYVKVANVEFIEKEFDTSREQIRPERVLPSPETCPSRHKIERMKRKCVLKEAKIQM